MSDQYVLATLVECLFGSLGCRVLVVSDAAQGPCYRSSLFTMPFGLTEPLFVPEYWMPPSLFNLAENTGFDIESLIFCFGIGGIGSVFYNLFTRKRIETVAECERNHAQHKF
ncbi:MAG: hypothetical protein Q9N32_07220, partial [Gammaproteobacteria bacterium]|nr:hypothetical protein [Gammaproteobacteria bacterium]